MEDESSELLSSSLEQPEGAVVAASAHEEERSVSLATHFVVVGLDYERPAELEPFWKEAAPPKPETPATLRFLKPGAASAPTVRAGVSYKGRQLHRFPADDVESKTQLPSHLWLFVFPTGVVLETAPQPPCFFVNALTFADGSRSYVTCIKFYEKTPWSVKKSKRASQALGGDDGRIYAPKAICYVSTLPLFAFFKSYLAQLFLNSQPSSTNWNGTHPCIFFVFLLSHLFKRLSSFTSRRWCAQSRCALPMSCSTSIAWSCSAVVAWSSHALFPTC